MDTTNIPFSRIAEAIEYLTNFKPAPNEAERIPANGDFEGLFAEWVGTSPTNFLRYISVARAKKIVREEQGALFNAAFEAELSNANRSHSRFIHIERMTPAEYKNGGESLSINYSFVESPFGNLLMASTAKGICSMAFEDDGKRLNELKLKFPNAVFQQAVDPIQQNALFIFQNDWSQLPTIKLHLKGTDFQLKVWGNLLNIPRGKLSTYGNIANQIGKPKASRAVGTAIGSNPIAFLIPCHRVIHSTGTLGGYMWGLTRKAALIGWEGVLNCEL